MVETDQMDVMVQKEKQASLVIVVIRGRKENLVDVVLTVLMGVQVRVTTRSHFLTSYNLNVVK